MLINTFTAYYDSFLTYFQNIHFMAKQGQAKNTKNKAKHARLMMKKKNKLRENKIEHEKRIKAIVKKQLEQSKG